MHLIYCIAWGPTLRPSASQGVGLDLVLPDSPEDRRATRSVCKWQVKSGDMAGTNVGANDVPTWDGEPSAFERFAIACRWYLYGLKTSERHLAAPRIWNKLQGPAKTVVRHLRPEEYATEGGVDKLLAALRESPLQKLPIPDSFSRLEKWSSLQRRQGETVPHMLVREEELFIELQALLKRARERGQQGVFRLGFKGAGRGEPEPAKAPDKAPTGKEEEAPATHAPRQRPRSDPGASPGSEPRSSSQQASAEAVPVEKAVEDEVAGGFFEEELTRLPSSESRPASATRTPASADFDRQQLIRQALRSLYDEVISEQSRRPRQHAYDMDTVYEGDVLWQGQWEEPWADDYGDHGDFYTEESGTYYQNDWYDDPAAEEWNHDSYPDVEAYYQNEPENAMGETGAGEEADVDDPETTDLKAQEQEAYALAQAVAAVRGGKAPSQKGKGPRASKARAMVVEKRTDLQKDKVAHVPCAAAMGTASLNALAVSRSRARPRARSLGKEKASRGAPCTTTASATSLRPSRARTWRRRTTARTARWTWASTTSTPSRTLACSRPPVDRT